MPDGPQAAPGTIRRGGRTAVVQEKVFDATMVRLSEVGYSDFTVDAVAASSGVHKTTIYRRWRNKDILIAAAVAEMFSLSFPVPDTGSVDDDLRDFARGVVFLLHSDQAPIRGAVRVLFSDAASQSPLRELKRHLFERRYAGAAAMVRAGMERGELPSGIDATRLLELVAGPLYNRFLVRGQPLDLGRADQAAADALIAARAGACRAEVG